MFFKTIIRARVTRQLVFTLTVGILIGFTFAYLMLMSSVGFESSRTAVLLGYPGRHEDTRVAEEMFKDIRILCWIMTCPKNHEKKARHVKATWGKRCNVLLFMSSEKNDSLPAVGLPVGEGRDNLWAKTKEAFKYVYKHHRNDADWFLKADDDTYVIMENLRYLLMPYKASEPLYFGCRFKPYVKQGYMGGGAGYVLSAESVRRFVEEAIPNKTLCKQSNAGAEDAEIGKCLENVGVKAMDTRDSQGRGRFFPFVPERHLFPKPIDKKFWYWKYTYYESKLGLECCSDTAISFHYVPPKQMYVLEYFVYHLRPYGISYNLLMPPANITTDNILTNNEISSSNNGTESTIQTHTQTN